MLSYSRQVPKIHDYGVVGDCRAAALISRYGSVDWLCWPRFDSPSIFASILDQEKGGHWSISPVGFCEFKRAYIGDSNVLETHFVCAAGRATLTDLFPVASEEFKRRNMLPDHELLRQIATIVLTTISAAAQGLGLTRMNFPYMLGTIFTPNRDRARLYGFGFHVAAGWLFSLIYVLIFQSLGAAGWWRGAVIGLLHAFFVLVVVMGLLPGFHPTHG